MLARLSSAELGEWMAYYNLEPWGKEQERAAVIGAIVANGNRGEKQEPLTPHDVLPDVPEPEDSGPVIKSAQELKQKFGRYLSAKKAAMNRGR